MHAFKKSTLRGFAHVNLIKRGFKIMTDITKLFQIGKAGTSLESMQNTLQLIAMSCVLRLLLPSRQMRLQRFA